MTATETANAITLLADAQTAGRITRAEYDAAVPALEAQWEAAFIAEHSDPGRDHSGCVLTGAGYIRHNHPLF